MYTKQTLGEVEKYIEEVVSTIITLPEDLLERIRRRMRIDLIAELKEEFKDKKKVTPGDVRRYLEKKGDKERLAVKYMVLEGYFPIIPRWMFLLEIAAGFGLSFIPEAPVFILGVFLITMGIMGYQKAAFALEVQKLTFAIASIIIGALAMASTTIILSNFHYSMTHTVPTLLSAEGILYIIVSVVIGALIPLILWKKLPESVKKLPWIPVSLTYKGKSKKHQAKKR